MFLSSVDQNVALRFIASLKYLIVSFLHCSKNYSVADLKVLSCKIKNLPTYLMKEENSSLLSNELHILVALIASVIEVKEVH